MGSVPVRVPAFFPPFANVCESLLVRPRRSSRGCCSFSSLRSRVVNYSFRAPPSLLAPPHSTMAAVATSALPEAQKQELLCTYAALILSDDKMDVTAENIQKLVVASGNTVEPYMPTLFARALQGQNIADLISNAGACAAAAPVAAAPVAGGDAGAAPAKEEKKEEPEEEEDDMGFSLFD
uniref:Ribosomal protein RPP1 n=1 Tax=Toxoplasma gondii COUG TaxID=1074873 RepID=A0A2G8YDB6_TOXGO|nr:ribosomal protein RPP1 [Toxoplasma gondii COUG]